ncbi:hypothetical protein [Pseudoalteromonas luteoviolacea]|uniref:DUF445 domain-containing protein n=1 Tax=Pseudoalteromonas luteoviolacea NCIMB 1942 TaxID=1365253 RepID=A0A162ABH5_9GAMM|nr:hypothetical protein [Pseudoalteromonas luteoviolacea]KZN47073.1 hypothetical protein N482_10825 [Pseudoalteromonas luteoviolacea NCIMB 1942]KZX00320.1 hypothetical protein JL49_12055 [Pseudoalteromonas luteoviolacea]
MNKSVLTNLLAAALVAGGWLSQNDLVLTMGLFALSGAVTNWLAVHMLFEKVPGLYGSGVITIKFKEFKVAIKELILDEFFNQDKLQSFASKNQIDIDLNPVIEHADLSIAFNKLVQVIEGSQFGAMLAMVGGKEAIEPMRDTFTDKMKEALKEISEEPEFKDKVSGILTNGQSLDSIRSAIEHAVDERLNELTPVMVKNIVQNMIHTHLGWLVVWGGVFGGIFGLIASFV